MSRKRSHSVSEINEIASKRPNTITNNEDSEFFIDSMKKPLKGKSKDYYKTVKNIPNHLIGLMYRIDLFIFCLLRKLKYKKKYPSLRITFEDTEVNKFSNITLHFKDESIHVKIDYVVKYYIDIIGYSRLFNKGKGGSYIENCFNCYAEHQMCKLDSSSNNTEYFIIFTNSGLDITNEKKLKHRQSRSFYPFKFDEMNIEELDIVKDFLFTNNNVHECAFYQFSQCERTREELLKRLEFSPSMQKVMKDKGLSKKNENRIKEGFVDKLIFAVNRPNREELSRIVKSEIENKRKTKEDYVTLQERVLRDFLAKEKHKENGDFVPEIVFKFNLIISLFHDMFLNKSLTAIYSRSDGISFDIAIHYKGKISYIKAYCAETNINYNQLFPARTLERKNKFAINKHLTIFIDELEKGKKIKHFVIYTEAGLDLSEENILNRGQSKDFHPLKIERIDIQKKKFKIFRNCSCIDKNGLYQFSQEEKSKVSSLLKLPPSFQREKIFPDLDEKEIIEFFLEKLIFAVNQPNTEELKNIIKNELENNSNQIPYNYEELYEIALRCSESHEFGTITKRIIEKVLVDIKNNVSSYEEIKNEDIDEEIKFAKSIVGREDSVTFNLFLEFVTKGEGIKCLEVLKRKEINLSNMSNILSGSRSNATKAFKDLFDLWFDEHGDKTHYLTNLEKEGMSLSNMTSILGGAGGNAVRAFKDLYDLWFDGHGNRTQYLKTLEKEEINLSTMSGILSGARANGARAFKDLYDLWFDAEGNKTKHLKTLEQEGVSLSNMSSILSGARANAAKAFIDLYNLWFDKEGNKTHHLKTLEKEGINLSIMSSILSGARTNAAKAFKELYDLWFDIEGNKSLRLKTLEKEGINVSNMSSILSGAGANAAKAFINLYDLWFDTEGNKTQHLKTLEKERVSLSSMSNILHRAGTNASKSFKELYDLWFDAEGNKTIYLITLENEGIHLSSMSSILGGAGPNAAKAFKDLYYLWFDKEGNKTQYLNTLEKEGMDVSNMSGILGRVGNNASMAFKKLYNTFFDEQGNKKPRLKHFIRGKDDEKSFTMDNLSSILGGAGARAKDAFESLHNVCFNDEGKQTELLDDFYNAGFRPSNLSCMLCRSGFRASSVLKKLHAVCFNKNREKTKLLDDFYNAGFSPYDICNILSGAANNLEKFHDFCFIGETKIYLNHFLDDKDSFTLSNLCNMLHGTKANVCSTFKDFHDICFDEKGNKTQLFSDFYNAGLGPNDLSSILSMAGNNAVSIFKKFHKSCFSKNDYLNHFLAGKKLFKSKHLAKILYGVGINISPIFEKLHNLCFDEAGNETSYFKQILRDNPSKKIPDILYKKVRGASY